MGAKIGAKIGTNLRAKRGTKKGAKIEVNSKDEVQHLPGVSEKQFKGKLSSPL